MRKSLTVFSALLKNWLRSKSGVFFSFLFPLLLLLIFGSVFGGGGNQEFTLYVQNRDSVDGQPTELSGSLENALESTDVFDIKHLPADIDVNDYISEHPSFTTYRVLVIPENFQQKAMSRGIYVRTGVILDTMNYIMDNYENYVEENQYQSIENGMESLENWRSKSSSENVGVTLLTSEGDASASTVRGIVRSVVNVFNNHLIGSEPVAQVNSDDLAQKDLNSVDYYLPGYIAAFIMTNGIIAITGNISEFTRNGVIKRLAATPLKKSSWIMGNLILQTLLAFMLTLVMIGVAWLVFGVQAIPGPFALSLIFLGAIVFSMIGIVLGGMIKDVEAANAIGNAIAFPMMFLSGAFFPLEMMPSYMQKVAECLPLYYFHHGLRQIMIQGNLSQTVIPFALLGVLAVLFGALAIKVTKWEEW